MTNRSGSETLASDLSESAKQWLEFTKELGEVGLKVHKLAGDRRAPGQQREINQALLSFLCKGTLLVTHMDPDYPDWFPWGNNTFLDLCASPDNIYYISRIRGSGTYRITGQRGTVRRIDLAVQHGFIGFSEKSPTVDDVDIDDLKIERNGTFEIILSPVQPAGYRGNWIKLDASVDNVFLMVRQVSYDWPNETDGSLTIQRIDRPIDQPRRRDSINERLAQVPRFVDQITTTLMGILARQYPEDHEINRVEDMTSKVGDQSIIAGQSYNAGEIVLGEDEALVVEFDEPKHCPYWNTQLVDSFFSALDFTFHQSNLNSHTAVVDPDGKIRIVVSQRDPGVANWMDKGNYEQNVLRFRWYKGGVAAPSSKKVKFSELSSVLHPDTPRISPDERQQQLRRRVELLQRRRRW